MNDFKQRVNKRILINAFLVLIFMIGSFSVRELYSGNPVVEKVFGGIRILVVWAIGILVIYRIDLWIFGERDESQAKKSHQKRFFITKKTVAVFFSILLLFFVSLRVFEGINFILFWLIFIILSWLVSLWIEHRRKGKNIEEENKVTH